MVLVFLWPTPLCSLEQPEGCSKLCQLAIALRDWDARWRQQENSSTPVKPQRTHPGVEERCWCPAAPPGHPWARARAGLIPPVPEQPSRDWMSICGPAGEEMRSVACSS